MGSICSCHCFKRSSKKIVIMFVGLDDAGKTTAVKGLTGECTENILPSIGFSCSTLKYKNNEVKLYDLGGNSSIRGIWPKYFADVHGIVFVVDASAVNRIEECSQELKKLLENEKLAGKPVLLLANKQDLPGALDEIDLVEKLGLESLVNKQRCPTSVETCAAVFSPDPAIQNGYKWLTETIIKHYIMLDERVARDMETEKIQEKLIMEERLKRISKLSVEATISNENENDIEIDHNPFRPISEIINETNGGGNTVKQIVVSEKKSQKGGGLFSRKNKTAPLSVEETSPVKKQQLLPPLKQVKSNDPVPWIKPVLTSGQSIQEEVWGLQQELETVNQEYVTNGTHLTHLNSKKVT